ncbi:hypothetical protein [Streptomyces sp. NPDC090057]|uniref:hypothetical protein n=1 Tax=Streptomyces sp. NPDC090057 TaxID=3365935 RepID=UPI0037F7033C
MYQLFEHCKAPLCRRHRRIGACQLFMVGVRERMSVFAWGDKGAADTVRAAEAVLLALEEQEARLSSVQEAWSGRQMM